MTFSADGVFGRDRPFDSLRSLSRHGLDDCLAADPPVNLIQPARLDRSIQPYEVRARRAVGRRDFQAVVVGQVKLQPSIFLEGRTAFGVAL